MIVVLFCSWCVWLGQRSLLAALSVAWSLARLATEMAACAATAAPTTAAAVPNNLSALPTTVKAWRYQRSERALSQKPSSLHPMQPCPALMGKLVPSFHITVEQAL